MGPPGLFGWMLPDKDGAQGKGQQHQKHHHSACTGDDEIPLDEFFGDAHIIVDGIQFFAAEIFGPHVSHVHIPDQLVQGQAKIVAEQDQPLKVGVGLGRLLF